MDTTIPDANVIRIAVDLACRAPSVHNSQPWYWRYSSGQLDLFADRSRLLPSTDPTGRQLDVSCGAALHHLQVALASLRWRTSIRLFPESALPRFVASVHLHHDAHPQSRDFDLLAAIRHRRTDRRPFAPLPQDEDEILAALHGAAAAHGVTVTVLPPEARATLTVAAESSSAARRYDSAYQAELHWWAGHSRPAEGIPPDALATAGESTSVSVGRAFPPAHRSEASAAAADAAVVLMLGTATDTAPDWVRCGQALSAVVLEATSRRVATCPLTHLTEDQRSRDLIAGLAPDAGFPQVLVRIGTATGPRPPHETPRRPATEVLSLH